VLSLLQVVAATPGIRLSQIAAAQGVHPSQITRQIRELEVLELVRVEMDELDRRSYRVELTRAGDAELQRLTEFGLDQFASFVRGWEAEEVQMLTSLLGKLEASKAAVSARERPSSGRPRARQVR